MLQRSTVQIELLPADSTLTVCRSLCNAQGLPNLCLGQTQGESPKFESFCKLLDFIQIDPIHNIAVRLVDGWLICAKIRMLHWKCCPPRQSTLWTITTVTYYNPLKFCNIQYIMVTHQVLLKTKLRPSGIWNCVVR